MRDWNKGTKRYGLVEACEDREIDLEGDETRGDMLELLQEHDEASEDPEDGEGDDPDPEARPRARSEAPKPKPVDDHTVAAPTQETRDRTSTRPPRRPIDGNLPVSDRTVAAPKPSERPAAPTQFHVGARVVIKDYGKRHGTILEIDEDLLLVKLDGAVLDPNNKKRMVNKVEVDKARCRLCAPEAA